MYSLRGESLGAESASQFSLKGVECTLRSRDPRGEVEGEDKTESHQSVKEKSGDAARGDSLDRMLSENRLGEFTIHL